MKLIASISIVAAMAFAGCGSNKQDMTKFNKDLATYMEKYVVEKEGRMMEFVTITADCTPDGDKANCNIVFNVPLAKPDKATAENVRRVGDKFVWDHES